MDSTQLIIPGQSAARPKPSQTLKYKTEQYGVLISIIVYYCYCTRFCFSCFYSVYDATLKDWKQVFF